MAKSTNTKKPKFTTKAAQPPISAIQTAEHTVRHRKRHILLIIFALTLLGAASYSLGRWSNLKGNLTRALQPPRKPPHTITATLYDDLIAQQSSESQLLRMQEQESLTSVDVATTQQRFERANYFFEVARPVEALWILIDLKVQLQADHLFVSKSLARIANQKKQTEAGRIAAENARRAQEAAVAVAGDGIMLPILIYHKTPPNFEAQLQQLQAKHYTTITMAQATCGIQKTCELPAKPVVVTYDDGFSDQLTAFALLQKYNMRATFYLIIGGDRSGHCIGIERTQGLPCGDSYMNWGEVKTLAASPLVEIGAHTVDHLNLASLNEADQNFQILTSKQHLEQTLGVAVTSFAYPYGAFNAASIRLVRQAGFTNAVSTIDGAVQSKSFLYALHRVRDPFKLP